MRYHDQAELREELERLRRRRRSVRPQALHRILSRAGFTRRYGKGDHWVYRHPDLHGRRLVVDPRNPLLPAYVTKAMRALEEVLE